jgi:hypothetical protein
MGRAPVRGSTPGVEDGATHGARARINAAGAYSTYGRTPDRRGDGPPGDVTGFAVNVMAARRIRGTCQRRHQPHYRLRHSPATSGASWNAAVDLVPRIGRPATSVHVPALTGTYLLKAVDLGGRESLNATLSGSSIADVLGFNAVETVTEALRLRRRAFRHPRAMTACYPRQSPSWDPARRLGPRRQLMRCR